MQITHPISLVQTDTSSFNEIDDSRHILILNVTF